MTGSKYSVKHKKLIETGKALFFKYGVKRVSVAEICKEAGVSKMTFYKHYKNKGELAKEFLLEMNEKGMREYRELMAQDIPFSEKVKQIIQNKVRDTEGISKEFIKDIFGDPKLGLLKVMEEQAEEGLNALLNDFRAAAERGEIRKGIKPEFIAYFLEKIRQMMADEQLLALYEDEQELILEVNNFFFYGLGIKNE